MTEPVAWADRLRRWDAQQEGYVPQREARFTAMFDVLEALLPAALTALDLGCGPRPRPRPLPLPRLENLPAPAAFSAKRPPWATFRGKS